MNTGLAYNTQLSTLTIPEYGRIVQELVKNMGRGGGQPNINKEMIKQFPTVKIDLIEQNEIVEFLDSKTQEIDDLVQLEQKKIDLLKEYRQSLISEVVTGKIKVTTDE